MENPNIITYSNYLIFNGRKLAFRKYELFDITDTPSHVKYNGKYWLIKGSQLTTAKAKELVIKEPVEINLTGIQWYIQEQLKEVFNL